MKKNKVSVFIWLNIFILVGCIQTKSTHKTVLELTKLNILFSNIDNPIEIASSEYPIADLIVTIDNGEIYSQDDKYIAIPDKPTTATITVSARGEILQEFLFKVKRPKNTCLALEIDSVFHQYKIRGDITREEILNAKGFEVILEHFEVKMGFDVLEFKLSAMVNDSVRTAVAIGNRISAEQKEIVRRVKSGTNIFIEDVKIAMPEGVRKLPATIYRLK